MRDGESITIATREAVASDDLHHLETEVLATFRRRARGRSVPRAPDAQRLYLAAIRQICRFLKSERAPAFPGGPGIVRLDRLRSMTQEPENHEPASTTLSGCGESGASAGSARASGRLARTWQ